MNEGNMDVQQITNHACTGDYTCHKDWKCHKWGDPGVKTHAMDFAPGDNHTIDSRKPFTYSQKFDVHGDDLIVITTISQGDRQVVKRMGPGNSQLNAMLGELKKGMAFVTGYWFARDMNWMDGEVCGSGAEHCNMHPAYLSNWRITSNDGPSPPGPAPPSPGPAPPSPPAPAPAPPSGGKCCWGPSCSYCQDDPSNWCNQNVRICRQCNGEWCTA